MPQTVDELILKVQATHTSIKQRLIHAESDDESFYELSNKRLLIEITDILRAETDEEIKKEDLKTLLAKHWKEIKKNPSYTYCAQPRDPINQLCLSVAHYIHPLPENLAECDNWGNKEGPYFILMPDLEAYKDVVLETNIHQLKLNEFILSEDNKRYIPIFDTLDAFINNSAKKPIHVVFSDQQNDIDQTNDVLQDSEIEQLRNHSELTSQIVEYVSTLKDPGASLFNRLKKLADGLLEGSSHYIDANRNGVGQSLNAAEPANLAIAEFLDYWDNLPEGTRDEYLVKIPRLAPIFQRFREPVHINNQGVEYCVGVTSSAVRQIANDNLNALQNSDLNQLQALARDLITQLEGAIKKPDYTVTLKKEGTIPFFKNILNYPNNEQKRLIKKYFHSNYPNFLFYILNQQVTKLSSFIEALQHSTQKLELLKERDQNGRSFLISVAQGFPEALETLLPYYEAFNKDDLLKEFMLLSSFGEPLISIILQRRPQMLPLLLRLFKQLDPEVAYQIISQKDQNNDNLLSTIIENQEAFHHFIELAATFSSERIAELLLQTNHQGDTLLLQALSSYPHAVNPLMNLFNCCEPLVQQHLLSQLNKTGFNLAFLMINTAPACFQQILGVMLAMPTETLKPILSSVNAMGETFFLRAIYGYEENFNAVLTLLDQYTWAEQASFLQHQDGNGNHLLLLAMLHQKIPSVLLFTKLQALDQDSLYAMLSTHNRLGDSPLTLALTQCPQYFPALMELIDKLTPAQQQTLCEERTQNGYLLPTLSAIYGPAHLPFVLRHVGWPVLLESLKQTGACGNSLTAIIAFQKPECFSEFITKLKILPSATRYELLNHRNAQGDNLLSAILQHDKNQFFELLPLMDDFTHQQRAGLITQGNHQNQCTLTLAYLKNLKFLDELIQKLETDKLSKQGSILKELETVHWFQLLTLACSNSPAFVELYSTYKKMHLGNKKNLSELLSQLDSEGNNLFMLIIKNNPSLIHLIFEDVKGLTDEKAQAKILLQTSSNDENVFTLAQHYIPNHLAGPIHLLIKKVRKDNTATRRGIGEAIKMVSVNASFSSEALENCEANELFEKLRKTDENGNNLLGQIIIQMPHFLPTLLERMQSTLVIEKMKPLFIHQNNAGLNLYGLSLHQPKAFYLSQQMQLIINQFDDDSKRMILNPPGEQSIIELALEQGGTALCSTLQWIESFSIEQHNEIIKKFWQKPSKQLQKLLTKNDTHTLQQLITTTRHFQTDDLVALMSTHRTALMDAMVFGNKMTKGLIYQWLLRLPHEERFKILPQLSVESITRLLTDEESRLIDTLPPAHLAQLLSLHDSDGHDLLVILLASNHPAKEALLKRLLFFTPNQLISLLKLKRNGTSLMHLLASSYPEMFERVVDQLQMLPIRTQFELLSQTDFRQLTPLDVLPADSHLYERILNLYQRFSQTEKIHLFTHQVESKSLLMRVPVRFRKQLLDQLSHLPQNNQIDIFMTLIQSDAQTLQTWMTTTPILQSQLLDMIECFPKHTQNTIYTACNKNQPNLIHWMIRGNDQTLTERGIRLLSGLAKTDIGVQLEKREPNTSNNFLQTLTNCPAVYKEIFAIFKTLSPATQTEILSQKNQNGQNLLKKLAIENHFQQFEELCQHIAQLPAKNKETILRKSSLFPIDPPPRWLILGNIAPVMNNFINAMNNKAFYPAMADLLRTLPPQFQINALTNLNENGPIINAVFEPAQTKLRDLLAEAENLKKARQFLDKMAATIPNEQINEPVFLLHQRLVQRLDTYQNTYHKTNASSAILAADLTSDIETIWPTVENKLTFVNILLGLIKVALSIILPAYGGYHLHQKITTGRNIFFQTEREKIIYGLLDVAKTIDVAQRAQWQTNLQLSY